jgi:transglutaminase-like putative cysteine protease
MISTQGWRFIGRIINRLRADEGWLTVFAVLAAVVIVAGSLEEARWLRRLPSLYACAVLAATISMITARLVRNGRLGGLLVAAAGLIFSVLTAAEAWPSWLLITSNLRYAILAIFQPNQPLPTTVTLPAWMLERFSQLAEAVSIWQQGVSTGEAGTAPQIFTLILLLTVWAVSAWAGWATFRYQRPLIALLPAGFLLAANIYFAGSQVIWLAPFMAMLVILAMRIRQFRLERSWEANNIDYSPEYRLELYLSGLMVAATVAGFMFLTPTLRVSAVSSAFWNVFRKPYKALEARVEHFLPDLDHSPRSLVDRGVSGGGGLPRSHLIGDAPDLSEQVVMTVSTNDPDPIKNGAFVNYRWRGITFSNYDGHGWTNPPKLTIDSVEPGEVWRSPNQQATRTVRQVFEITASPAYWLYGLAEPLAADRSFQVHLRGPNDVVGFEANTRNYTLISQIPNASESDLRSVISSNADVLATYLTLPDSMSGRVLALAEEVTAESQTPYDKAKALETHLRTYPYDLNVPQPPADIEITDYFLFDLQRGYCDYYATSMVVMARSLGLPARLAVGYAAGTYNNERRHFSVVEADAHSWPELYFFDYGWIPFEPTAAQPAFIHQPLEPKEDATHQTSLDLTDELVQLRRQSWLMHGVWRWALIAFSLLALLLVLRSLWREWCLRRQAANPGNLPISDWRGGETAWMCPLPPG